MLSLLVYLSGSVLAISLLAGSIILDQLAPLFYPGLGLYVFWALFILGFSHGIRLMFHKTIEWIEAWLPMLPSGVGRWMLVAAWCIAGPFVYFLFILNKIAIELRSNEDG